MQYTEQFLSFWSWYGGNELNATLKGSKTEAFKSYEKAFKRWVKDNKELADLSMEAFNQTIHHGYMIHEKNRRNAQRANRFVPRLKNASTWLNQSCWEYDVPAPSSSYGTDDRAPTVNTGKCSCGQDAIGRTADLTGWICRDCYTKEWYEQVKGADERIARWTPRAMIGSFPKLEGETWPQWSQRVAKELVRRAPKNSPIAQLKVEQRVDDQAWFRERGWKA